MADYWHKVWACPYFVWDEKLKIGCEGSIVIRFPSTGSLCKYADTYCCSIKDYHKCKVAEKIEKKYGGEKNDKGADGRKDKETGRKGTQPGNKK